MDYIKKYNQILGAKQRFKFFKLYFLILINSFLEFLSIGAIIPFLQGLTDQKDNILFRLNLNNYIDIDKQNIFSLSLFIFFTIFIIKFIFSIYLNLSFQKFLENLRFNLSKQFIENYIHSSILLMPEIGISKILKIMNNEIDIFCLNITDALIRILLNLTLTILLTSLILLFYPSAFYLLLALIIIISSLNFTWYKPKIKNFGLTRSKLIKEKISLTYNIFNAFIEIKVFAKETFFKNKCFENFREYFMVDKKYYIIQNNIKPIIEFLTVCVLIIYFIFKVQFIGNSDFIIELALISAASFRILPSLNSIVYSWITISYYKPTVDELFEQKKTLSIQQSNLTNKKIINFKDSLVLSNIFFHYQNGKEILNNFSFEIKKNDVVGISGASGSGKTTLINIILGLLKKNKGKIFVNNEKVNEEYLLNASYVSQNIALINDTIKKNIAIGSDENDINNHSIQESLAKSELLEFVQNLPLKENTKINEMGSNLSGGQKQRISLARAYYNKKNLIILDEPTSALDFDTSQIVIDKTIKDFETVIIISHDKNILKKCNKIFNLN